MLPVLVIDDNEAVGTALQVLFDLHDIPCLTATTPQTGLAIIREQIVGAVIQDMNFEEDQTSGEEGIRLFHEIKSIDPLLPVLLITAWTSLESAVKLVKEGAHDYLSKPWDDEKLLDEITHLLESRQKLIKASTQENSAGSSGLIYADPVTHRVINTAMRIARADVPVLITGPNGSGKEMLAHLIQDHSARAQGPFIKVNAGGLPDELLEAELFGSEAGAYTGAQKRRIGRFEEANGGALFLDEIGNLSMTGQMKLLRVLQSGELSRLGSNRIIKTDCRIISATNTDLTQAIRDGKFREDLYFRLNVVEIHLPALKDRPGDIEPLIKHFLDEFAGDPRKQLTKEVLNQLRNYHWPGNVRELRNRIQRAVLISENSNISTTDLGFEKTEITTPTPSADDGEEARSVKKALYSAGGNVSRAASELGVSRQALYRRMEKYGIVWERKPQS